MCDLLTQLLIITAESIAFLYPEKTKYRVHYGQILKYSDRLLLFQKLSALHFIFTAVTDNINAA